MWQNLFVKQSSCPKKCLKLRYSTDLNRKDRAKRYHQYSIFNLQYSILRLRLVRVRVSYSAFKRLKTAKQAKIKFDIQAAITGGSIPPYPRDIQKLCIIQKINITRIPRVIFTAKPCLDSFPTEIPAPIRETIKQATGKANLPYRSTR